MLYRSVAIVGSLLAGDYLLWNWSLAGNHGSVAIFSGLSMPLLLLALVWLIVRSIARLVSTQRVRSAARQKRLANSHNTAPKGMSPSLENRPSDRDAISSTDKLAA